VLPPDIATIYVSILRPWRNAVLGLVAAEALVCVVWVDRSDRCVAASRKFPVQQSFVSEECETAAVESLHAVEWRNGIQWVVRYV